MSKHKTHCASGLYNCIAQTQILYKPRVALNINAIAYSREMGGTLSIMMQQCLGMASKCCSKKAIRKQLFSNSSWSIMTDEWQSVRRRAFVCDVIWFWADLWWISELFMLKLMKAIIALSTPVIKWGKAGHVSIILLYQWCFSQLDISWRLE